MPSRKQPNEAPPWYNNFLALARKAEIKKESMHQMVNRLERIVISEVRRRPPKSRFLLRAVLAVVAKNEERNHEALRPTVQLWSHAPATHPCAGPQAAR